MADMQVAMRLTLADAASGPLAEFVAKLEKLKGLTEKLNGAFAGVGKGISSLGVASKEASDSITAVGDSTARTEEKVRFATASMLMRWNKAAVGMTDAAAKSLAAVEKFGAGAYAASETVRMATSGMLMRWNKAAAGIKVAAAEAAASMEDVGLAANSVMGTINKVAASTAALGEATYVMNDAMLASAFTLEKTEVAAAGAGGAVDWLTTKFGALGNTMRGLIEIWAGFKIEKGLKESVSHAATYQDTMLKLQARNLAPGELGTIQSRSRRESRNNPYYSINDTLNAELAALPGLPGDGKFMQAMRAQLVPYALKVAQVLKLYGDKSSLSHQVQNIFGVVEAMGGAENPAKAKWIMKAISGGAIGTGGKVDVRSLETSLRMMNRAVSTNMTQDQLRAHIAMLEEFKAAGGGGAGGSTRAATIANSIYTASVGGVMRKAGADLLVQLGLVDPSKVLKYGHSSTQAIVEPNALKDSKLALTSTTEWVRNVAAPALTKYTWEHWKQFGYKSGNASDLHNSDQIATAVAQLGTFLSKMGLGGQTLGSGLAMLSNPNVLAAMDAQVLQQKRAASPEVMSGKILGNWHGALHALHSQIGNLGQDIGTQLIPVLTRVAKWFTKVVAKIDEMAKKFPNLTRDIAVAAAGFGAFAILSGTLKLFGLMTGSISSLVGWLFKIGPAAKVAAAETVTATETMAAATTTAAAETSVAAATMTSRFAGLFALVRKFSLIAAFVSTASGDSMPSNNGSGNVSASAALAMAHKESVASYGGKMTAAQLRNAAADFMVPAGGGDRTKRNSPAYLHAFAAIDAALHPKAKKAKSGASDVSPVASETAAIVKHAMAAIIPGGKLSALGADPKIHKGMTLAERQMMQDVKLNIRLAVAKFRNYERIKKTVEEQAAKADPVKAAREKYAAYSKTLGEWGNTGMAKQALLVGEHAANQAGYKQSTGSLQKLKAQLSAEEQLIAARKESGAITKQQSAQQDIAAQKGIAPAMERAAEAALKYARALKDPTLIAAMQAQIEKIKAMGTQLNDVQRSMQNTVQGGIQGLLSNMMRGNMTWGHMLAQFNNSILSGMNSVISKKVAQSITGSASSSSFGQFILGLFGSNGAGGSKSGTSSSASADSGGSGLSGIATEIASSSWGQSAGSWLAGLFGPGTIGSYATGIDNVPHDMVAQIHAGERVVDTSTNKVLTNALKGGAIGGGHTVNLSIHAMDSQSVLGAMDGIKRELSMMLGGASSNLNLMA